MRHFRVIVGCALLYAASAGQATAGLVTNGGFETGDFTGWTLSAHPNHNFVFGDFVHSGRYAAWFGEIGGLGSLSQSIATTAGEQYTFSFWFAGDGDTPSKFQALIDSTVYLDLDNPAFDFDYVEYSYTFTATSDSTLVTFKFMDEPYFINLDDVDVTPLSAAPEPTTIALAGLGSVVALVGAARRRRLAK